MLKLAFRCTLPLTVLAFGVFTKWWYALPVDAPDSLLVGFPWPYVCEGWHTSMSLQLFLMEGTADFLVYFLTISLLISIFERLGITFHRNRSTTIILWSTAGLLITYAIILVSISNTIHYVKRPFDMKVLETGYRFIWQQTERPDYNKFQTPEPAPEP